MSKYSKLECDACGALVSDDVLLQVQNPSNPSDTIHGCPWCMSEECFTRICDAAGCEEEATCVTPTMTSNTHTCGAHRPQPAGGQA